jgi:hypothetical protein
VALSLSPVARERCAWCEKPLPAGRRTEAEYCDKRCRQASSRFGLAVKRSAPAPADSDTSRRLSEEAPRDTSSTETTAGRQLDATRRARGPEQRLANRAAASRDAPRMPRDAEQRKLADDALADVSDASPALADDPLAQPSVRALVLDALGEHDRRVLLEGGTPRHEHSTSSGPLRPEVALRRREIRVAQYTPAAWRSQVAWHVYWRQHDYDTLDEQLRAGSPPTPRSEHRTERVTWGQARKWGFRPQVCGIQR